MAWWTSSSPVPSDAVFARGHCSKNQPLQGGMCATRSSCPSREPDAEEVATMLSPRRSRATGAERRAVPRFRPQPAPVFRWARYLYAIAETQNGYKRPPFLEAAFPVSGATVQVRLTFAAQEPRTSSIRKARAGASRQHLRSAPSLGRRSYSAFGCGIRISCRREILR